MKLPPVRYASPRSVDEVVSLLAAGDGDARILSGGQSLVPMLAFRLAAPELLVDIRRVPALDRIDIDEGGVTLGARVSWRDIEEHPRLGTVHPLLSEAVRHVAHYQIRNRGTVGGSLAHADPAAELPAVALACDATIVAVGPAGERRIPASDFFVAPLVTALDAAEIIVTLRLPPWPVGRRWGFEEFARRKGDFALAGAAIFWDEDQSGRIVAPRIVGFGVGDTPLRLRPAEALLDGAVAESSLIGRAAAAAAESVDPQGDLHADGEYRRALLATLLETGMKRAAGLA